MKYVKKISLSLAICLCSSLVASAAAAEEIRDSPASIFDGLREIFEVLWGGMEAEEEEIMGYTVPGGLQGENPEGGSTEGAAGGNEFMGLIIPGG